MTIVVTGSLRVNTLLFSAQKAVITMQGGWGGGGGEREFDKHCLLTLLVSTKNVNTFHILLHKNICC